MNVLVKWLYEGRRTQIYVGDKRYDAASVKGRIFDVENWPNPVARIKCTNDDYVYMTIADKEYSGFWFLPDKLLKAPRLKNRGIEDDENIIFPMVKLDQKVNISFLEGMTKNNGEYWVGQALQQTKFTMNHKGARAKSAVAMSLCKGIEKQMKIDKPFLIWMVRKGLSMPYFVGYIDYSNWEDPGEL